MMVISYVYVYDSDANKVSRFFIELNSIEDIDLLGEKYGVDVLVTKNVSFEDYISIVLYDEEINQDLY